MIRKTLIAAGCLPAAFLAGLVLPCAGAAAAPPNVKSPQVPSRAHSGEHKHQHDGRYGVGKVLLTQRQNNAVCTLGMNKRRRGRVAPWRAYADNQAIDVLHPGGIALLACGRQPLGPRSMIVAYDLFHRRVKWRRSVVRADRFATTPNLLLLFFHRRKPPSGLHAGSTTYTIKAFNIRSGKPKWRVPFVADNAGEEGSHYVASAAEGVAGVPGHAEAVVIGYLGTSAYDTANGALLWHTPNEYYSEASGSYVTDGVVEVYGYEDNESDSHITGVNAQDQSQLWDLRLPVPCSSESSELIGTIEWEFGRNCVTAHDVATGNLVLDEQYPTDWQSTAANSSVVLAFNGSTLALFSTTNLLQPIWAIPADSIEPRFVSAGRVLVEAPSGLLILSAANGKIVARVPGSFPLGRSEISDIMGPVNGLVGLTRVNGKSAILNLDH